MNALSFDDVVAVLATARDELAQLRAAAPAPAPTLAPSQDELVVSMAFSYQLPVVIVRAMAAHESMGIPFAVRYEPDFYNTYLKGKTPDFRPEYCSWETERIGRATSWGLMQVMGETARAVGFRGWFPELCQPAVGLEWGCRYLRRLADRYLADGGWPTVMRAYNGGPGNRDKLDSPYPGKILALIPGGQWPE